MDDGISYRQRNFFEVFQRDWPTFPTGTRIIMRPEISLH